MPPRGITEIAVSGGSAPYTVDLRPENERSGGDSQLDPHGASPGDGGALVYFEYKAGSLGGVTDLITVTDQAGAEVAVQVAVGQELKLSPGEDTRAPLQTEAFSVVGGEEPYFFAIASLGSACDGETPDAGGQRLTVCVATDAGRGSCISPDGNYTARSCGGGEDKITVTDATGTSRDAYVHVSSELQLQPTSARAAPGGTVFFAAQGGVPPYTFDFASRGDRSDGTMAGSGVYTAGPNPNVQDDVVVTDAVGAQVVSSVAVGSAAVDLPRADTYFLTEGDFNADGRPDLIAMEFSADVQREVISLMLGTGNGFGALRTFTLPNLTAEPDQLLVGDFNGDGTDDLVLVYSNFGSGASLQLLSGRRDGSFDFLPQVDFTADQVVGALVSFDTRNDPLQGRGSYLVALAAPVAPLDGGPADRELNAIAVGPSGNLEVVRQLQLPFSGTYNNEQLLEAPFPGYDTTIVVAHGSSTSGAAACAGGMQAWVLGWAVDSAGAPLRDPSSDQGPFCVPCADPDGNVLDPFFFDTNSSVPGFVVEGDGDSVALHTGSGSQFQATPIALPYDTTIVPGYWGSSVGTATPWDNFEPELVALTADAGVRYVLDAGAGALVSRNDPLPGGLADLVVTDFNGDGQQDAIALGGQGHLELLRASIGAHVAVGHARQLTAYAVTDPHAELWGSPVYPLDLDGDGVTDLLTADDTPRIFWGSVGGLAVGPRLLPGQFIRGVAGGQSGALVFTDDGLEDYALDALVVADGGLSVQGATVYVPSGQNEFVLRSLLQPEGAGARLAALLSGYDPSDTSSFTAGGFPSGGTALAALQSDGGVVVTSDDTLVGVSLAAPVNVTDGGVDDLVVADNTVNGSFGASLLLYPGSPGASTLWSSGAIDAVSLESPFGDALFVSGLFSFATRAGGKPDAVLAVLAPVDSNNVCNPIPDPGALTVPGLYVFSVAGGTFSQLAEVDVDTLQLGRDLCASQYLWRVQAADVDGDGKNELIVRDDTLGPPQIISWDANGNVTVRGITAAPLTVDFAVGDFDGDGHADVALINGTQPELIYLLHHPDGTLY